MLPLANTTPLAPFREIVAYESLWADMENASSKKNSRNLLNTLEVGLRI